MRLINRCALKSCHGVRLANVPPHSKPIGEMLHWSALARWEETKIDRRRQRYQPRNLLAALKSVQDNSTPVVGLDGEPTSLTGLYTPATGPQPTPGEAPPSSPRVTSTNGADRGGNGMRVSGV